MSVSDTGYFRPIHEVRHRRSPRPLLRGKAMLREQSHVRKSTPGSAGVLHVGQVFAERYRIEGLLGGSRSSQVYEAMSLLDGRKVAVKAFEPQPFAAAGAVKRFEFVLDPD